MFCLCRGSFANDYYCDELNLGWNFYCDPELEEEKIIEKETSKSKKPVEVKTYTQQLEEVHKLQKEYKARMMLNPTVENILAYEMIKKDALDRVSYVTQLTKRVQWQNANLNSELTNPISTLGKRIWIEERNKNISQTMKDLNIKYGLIFFFRSTCPYCHRYAPILKEVSARYGVKVLAVSLDRKCLKEFPNCRFDKGEATTMKIEAVPTTLLFEKKSKSVQIIGTGLLSISELEERIFKLLKVKVGDEY